MAILFAQDWARHPEARLHLTTKNTSFIRLASVYRSMGVKNHAFILALHNHLLVDVDPHSPTLTIEEMAMVAAECKINPWYYLREVVRVPAIGGPETTPFEANRGNIALFWLFYNHIMQILIQPRQTGKSFSTDTLMVLLQEIVCVNTKINLMTKNDDLRRENIRRLKEIMDELPRYLDRRQADDTNNTEEITINALRNRYNTHVPQSSPKNALKLGRGLTTSIFHIDEPPFQTNISIAMPAALAAMSAATDKSKAAGGPYGIILTTTAGERDDKDGKYIYHLMEEAAVWTEMFFDCVNLTALEKMVRANSRGNVLRVACVFNHRQLGRTDEWLARKIEESTANGDAANRDFFNVWTNGTAASPFSRDITAMIAGSVRESSYSEIAPTGGYITRWYVPEDEIESRLRQGHHYILGMDTSEASGNDDISLYLMDASTMETVAVGNYNETNLITFSTWVASWFIRYPTITGIIERRSTGQMLIDHLLLLLPQAGIDPFRRLYNTIVQDSDDPANVEAYKEISKPMGRRDPSVYVRYKKTFGFATSGNGVTSRTKLYSETLQKSAKTGGAKVYDKPLIDQILALVVRNGRVDHEVGAHDDLVIGWLLSNWMVFQGKNLSFYGIDTKKLMSAVKAVDVVDAREQLFKQEQLYHREQIQILTERMSNERDDYICLKLEQTIRTHMSQVVFEENEIYMLDELISKAKEARRTKRSWAAQNLRHDTFGGGSRTYTSNDYQPLSRGGFADRPGQYYERDWNPPTRPLTSYGMFT